MVSGGISIQGSYHDINQDNYYSGTFKNGYVMVVSDGLGSKRNSQIGSKMVCESVLMVLDSPDSNELINCKEKLIAAIHKKWLSCLKNYNISECYATVLFCIVTAEKIIAARLGDGFLAFATDEQSIVLFDKKEEYFANETDCMEEELNYSLWEFFEIRNESFIGAIACTDGIGICPLDEQGYISFSKEFIEEYSGKELNDITEDIGGWLCGWTGNDDKTIAFLLGSKV